MSDMGNRMQEVRGVIEGRDTGQPAVAMQNVCSTVVGIVGGMGSYATLHFFRKLIDAFPAEKEWERPRVIIDNNCVMPSRVRAVLYGERRPELVEALADSVRRLLSYNVDLLALACNTAHCFLPEIRQRVSIPESVLVDIIETVTLRCRDLGISEVFVVATEGTIATRIYDRYCEDCHIRVSYPTGREQPVLREFIESVKQSRWDGLAEQFAAYLANLEHGNIVLGCTELSVIFDSMKNADHVGKQIIDPVEVAVEEIRTRIARDSADDAEGK